MRPLKTDDQLTDDQDRQMAIGLCNRAKGGFGCSARRKSMNKGIEVKASEYSSLCFRDPGIILGTSFLTSGFCFVCCT